MQAYTQALLGDKTFGSGVGPDGGVPCKVQVTTWVTLPPECRPKTKDGKYLWFQMGTRGPVVPLVRAPYGHPIAGGHWERHCNSHIAKCGFEAIVNWPSMLWHPTLKLLLMVFVDDFHMSRPQANIAKG